MVNRPSACNDRKRTAKQTYKAPFSETSMKTIKSVLKQYVSLPGGEEFFQMRIYRYFNNFVEIQSIEIPLEALLDIFYNKITGF